MKGKAILGDIEASLKNWYRNKAALFWTIAFPTLLILIFGAIFSGGGRNFTLGVKDLDDSVASKYFIENISSIGILEIKEVNGNIEDYVKEHGACLVIPEGFQESLFTGKKCNLTLYVDPSQENTNSAIRTFIMNVINKINLGLSNGTEYLGYKEKKITGERYEYIDFFIPGIIGMTIMTSAIYGTIERNVSYRKRGILKKLLTTPFKRYEWILSQMVYQLLLAFLSTFVIISVGKIAFNAVVNINYLAVATIISASFAFTGIGMLISRFVTEEESANSAASAVIFPMMFLAGTFFPLELMPSYLQRFAKILPLYYVNEGLRNSMIFGDFNKSIFYFGVTCMFAIVVFIMGAMITRWEEE